MEQIPNTYCLIVHQLNHNNRHKCPVRAQNALHQVPYSYGMPQEYSATDLCMDIVDAQRRTVSGTI